MKKTGLFAAGVLLGTAGLKMLGSKDAKKVYAHTHDRISSACIGLRYDRSHRSP